MAILATVIIGTNPDGQEHGYTTTFETRTEEGGREYALVSMIDGNGFDVGIFLDPANIHEVDLGHTVMRNYRGKLYLDNCRTFRE